MIVIKKACQQGASTTWPGLRWPFRAAPSSPVAEVESQCPEKHGEATELQARTARDVLTRARSWNSRGDSATRSPCQLLAAQPSNACRAAAATVRGAQRPCWVGAGDRRPAVSSLQGSFREEQGTEASWAATTNWEPGPVPQGAVPDTPVRGWGRLSLHGSGREHFPPEARAGQGLSAPPA